MNRSIRTRKTYRLQSVYAARNTAELGSRYDDWAADYDVDLGSDSAWISPRIAVGFLAKYVAADAKVLDAGAGTGLVGERLCEAGYRDLLGIDLSPGMLAVARGKGVYRELRQMNLGESLAFPDDAFDAVISVGVVTTGHAPAHAFDELVRVTRPGGVMVFSLRAGEIEEAFMAYFATMDSAGRWHRVECSEPFQPLPEDGPDVIHRIWVYRVNG